MKNQFTNNAVQITKKPASSASGSTVKAQKGQDMRTKGSK